MNENLKELFLERVFFGLLIYNMCDEVRKFIACQFALESDFGESAIARENYNYCGMKLPSSRPTSAVGMWRGHAVYNNIHRCIDDYFYWLLYNRFTQLELNDLFAFKSHLAKSGYCPSSDYVERIDNLFKQYYYN